MARRQASRASMASAAPSASPTSSNAAMAMLARAAERWWWGCGAGGSAASAASVAAAAGGGEAAAAASSALRSLSSCASAAKAADAASAEGVHPHASQGRRADPSAAARQEPWHVVTVASGVPDGQENRRVSSPEESAAAQRRQLQPEARPSAVRKTAWRSWYGTRDTSMRASVRGSPAGGVGGVGACRIGGT